MTLALAGYTLRTLTPSPRERFLTRLTDPDLAILLLLAGILLIYLEFNVPGTIIPERSAPCASCSRSSVCICFLFAEPRLACSLIGLALMIAEFKIPSHGVVASAGIIALIFGLITLVDAPVRELRVHPSTAIAAGLAFGLITLYLGSIALRARRNKKLLGPGAMVGQLAIVKSPLNPMGQVELGGELWQASLPTGSPALPVGASVLVREADGFSAPGRPRPLNAGHTSCRVN